MWRVAGFSIFCRFFPTYERPSFRQKKILDLIFVIHTNITPTALIDIQIFYVILNLKVE